MDALKAHSRIYTHRCPAPASRVVRKQLGTKVRAQCRLRLVQVGTWGLSRSGPNKLFHELGERAAGLVLPLQQATRHPQVGGVEVCPVADLRAVLLGEGVERALQFLSQKLSPRVLTIIPRTCIVQPNGNHRITESET